MNCLMITFLVGVGDYMYFGISLQLPNSYRICRVGSLFLKLEIVGKFHVPVSGSLELSEVILLSLVCDAPGP